MGLWEFSLISFDGTVLDQTAIAKSTSESEAAASALAGLKNSTMLSRPGRAVSPASEARWQELCDSDAFPLIVSNSGRLALHARSGS
jgi:hypothetical protein